MKIISLFRHLFIPHEGNDYKPHFFREHVVLTMLTLSIVLLLLSLTSYTTLRTTHFGSTVVSSVLVDLTNQTRIKNNLPPLSNNVKLKKAAYLKGEDMRTHGYFAHHAPDGTAPWHWLEKVGYTYSFAGENLAINFTNSEDVERAWLGSKKHRDNILNKNYEDIGIATIRATSYGIPIIFVVQMFGKSTSKEPLSTYTAKWYELLLFNGPTYVAKLYTFLVLIVMCALLAMIFIEIQRQHILHIVYGVLLLCVVIICLFLNSLLV
jgi:uncharacterized protein YkwD